MPALPTVIGSFKSAAARDINRVRSSPGAPVWQRGYFDRIIRDEVELAALREYILGNPRRMERRPREAHSRRNLLGCSLAVSLTGRPERG